MGELSIEYIKSLFDADFLHGNLIWNHRPRDHFQSDQGFKMWNTNYAGKQAGGLDAKGYRRVKIDGNLVKLHRLIWALAYGHWPRNFIDHINGNPSDNRLANLREATLQENAFNQKRQVNNTSGVKGVYFRKDREKWVSRITVDGKLKTLGFFLSKEEASQAYCAAAAEIYGEFARTK